MKSLYISIFYLQNKRDMQDFFPVIESCNFIRFTQELINIWKDSTTFSSSTPLISTILCLMMTLTT